MINYLSCKFKISILSYIWRLILILLRKRTIRRDKKKDQMHSFPSTQNRFVFKYFNFKHSAKAGFPSHLLWFSGPTIHTFPQFYISLRSPEYMDHRVSMTCGNATVVVSVRRWVPTTLTSQFTSGVHGSQG